MLYGVITIFFDKLSIYLKKKQYVLITISRVFAINVTNNLSLVFVILCTINLAIVLHGSVHPHRILNSIFWHKDTSADRTTSQGHNLKKLEKCHLNQLKSPIISKKVTYLRYV